jgi:hypothetical protein
VSRFYHYRNSFPVLVGEQQITHTHIPFYYLSFYYHSHNFQLFHAGEGTSEYSDHTGFMSGAIIGVHDKINFPKQCYNAQNHWDLGWYAADKMETVQPSTTGKLVKIVAFADVATATASADKVLVQTGGNLDLYMQYNRAKGFNEDTYEYKDTLVIVQDNGGGTMIRATLDKLSETDNEALYTRQESGNNNPLRIEICEQVYLNSSTKPDYMVVGIGYSSKTLCNPEPVAAETTTTTTTTSSDSGQTSLSALAGLFGNTAQGIDECLIIGQDCSYDGECCTQNCHNDSCTQASKKSKNSDYRLSLTDRLRGAGFVRGLRGVKGAVSQSLPVVD